MKVLITGPNLDDSKQVSGIITVINIIKSLLGIPYDVFIRSPAIGQRNLLGTIKWLGKIGVYIRMNKKTHYDVLHIHTAMNERALLRDFLWVYIGTYFCSSILLHLHGGKFLFKKSNSTIMNGLIYKVFRLSHALIVLSEKEKQSVINLYGGHKKIFVLENAINIHGEGRGELALEKSNDMINLVFLGRITESKGIQDLVKALVLLNKKTKKFRFDLYGEGELNSYVQLELGVLLGDRFKYHGIVSGKSKWKALEELDIFLLPSRYGEGLPMALLEAMSLGKMIIATDDASIGTIVKNGINGFIVEKYMPEAIFQTLLQIINLSDGEKTIISENAKAIIKKSYTADKYVEELESIYNQLATK